MGRVVEGWRRRGLESCRGWKRDCEENWRERGSVDEKIEEVRGRRSTIMEGRHRK